MQETWVQSLGWEDPLEKEMADHSSFLAWEVPWTEEPGQLESMARGSQRVRCNLASKQPKHALWKYEHNQWLFLLLSKVPSSPSVTSPSLSPCLWAPDNPWSTFCYYRSACIFYGRVFPPWCFWHWGQKGETNLRNWILGTSLVVQWLRLHAPNAGAQVRFLVRELDPACHNWELICHHDDQRSCLLQLRPGAAKSMNF